MPAQSFNESSALRPANIGCPNSEFGSIPNECPTECPTECLTEYLTERLYERVSMLLVRYIDRNDRPIQCYVLYIEPTGLPSANFAFVQ